MKVWFRQDGKAWLAWCPDIDVMTQAETKKQAVESIQSAVEGWFESCSDRGMLSPALKEVKQMIYGAPCPDNPTCTCGGKLGGVGECAACGSSCGCALCMDDRSCAVEGCEHSYCDECWGEWLEDGVCVPCVNAAVGELTAILRAKEQSQ